jgi:prepilin-type N-terminal cleavage/methylation domain-containing protein
MKSKKPKRGFTLIELLVAVLIIGILAAIALPQYQKAVSISKNAEIITNVGTLEKALQVAAMQLGKPVTDLASLDVGFINATSIECVPGGGTSFKKAYLVQDNCYFVSTHPDPFFTNHVIGYNTKGDGNVFMVYGGNKYCAGWVNQKAKDACAKIGGKHFKNINSNEIYILD